MQDARQVYKKLQKRSNNQYDSKYKTFPIKKNNNIRIKKKTQVDGVK